MENEENGGGLGQVALVGCPLVIVLAVVAVIMVSVIGYSVANSMSDSDFPHIEMTVEGTGH